INSAADVYPVELTTVVATNGSAAYFETILNGSSRFKVTPSQAEIAGDRILTTADEGAGNGLDADTVDGSHASAFATSGHNHDATYLGLNAKAADSELLDGLDGAYFRGLNSGGSGVDPNLADQQVILTNHANSPSTGVYWHITTTFYSAISSAANRGQIAIQYNGGTSAYIRTCYSSTWTSWVRIDNAGQAADADTVDGVHASSFLRSDVDDTTTGSLLILNDVGASPVYSNGQFEIRSSDAGDASMGFHRGGYTACQLRHSSNGLILSGTARTTAADLYVYGSITASSDARFKKDLRIIPEALSKIVSLSGYTYLRTNVEEGCEERRETGVVAQELLEVLPEAVTEDNDGHYSVAYGNMVGLLIEGIKELHKEIEELKNGG
ncbi:pyocin knob domain-containing S74 family peptidase, partial [bacterium]|nr:pyocin knob domain-containing S74 family peptidase [bacterium]